MQDVVNGGVTPLPDDEAALIKMLPRAENVIEISGQGMKCTVDGKEVAVSS
jgi:hypothetical protein